MDSCKLPLLQFYSNYQNNFKNLYNFCSDHKIILKELKCPKCDRLCRIDFNTKGFRCDKVIKRNKKYKKQIRCHFQQSLFKNTFFENSKINCFELLIFIQHFCLKSFSIPTVKRSVGLTETTIIDWASFCREVCISWVLDNSTEILGGVGTVVEIAEAKLENRKYTVGRDFEGQWAFGGFDRNSKKIFLVSVDFRDYETLFKVIEDHILPGTTIISHCWKGYNILENSGYTDLMVKHSINFANPVTGAYIKDTKCRKHYVKPLPPNYGNVKCYYVCHLARMLFLKSFLKTEDRFHEFIVAISKLYNPGF